MAVTHLLVGAGKMGGALLSGWLESGVVTPRKLAILDPSPGPKAIFAIDFGIFLLNCVKLVLICTSS